MPDTESSPWERAVRAGLAALLLLTAIAGAAAEPRAGPAGAPMGLDNWQQWWVPITTIETGGRVFLLEAVVYRPEGDGPFPLVTINHGKPRGSRTVVPEMHPGFEMAAGWFVDHGFAVALPMRRGFSEGHVSDSAGDCADKDYFASALLTAAEMTGVIAYMQRQSFVDPKNVVVVGHSWGALGALGIAHDAPPGVVGIINFAGGGGSFAPGQICGGADRLIADIGRLGAGADIPQIWFYAENDHLLRATAGACDVRGLPRQGTSANHVRRPADFRRRRPFDAHAERHHDLGASS